MAKTTQRRSRLSSVLSFFREGHPDEIRAVFHILAEEKLIPEPVRERGRRRRRLNGPDVQPDTIGHDTMTREAGA